METNLAKTISRLTLEHMNRGNLLLGQCLSAVGWVGGTVPKVPNHPNLIELSMSDVAGGGIATGAALFGSKPVYVVRYQGFLWYNLISVVNYAAKSKELWGVPCPIIVRAISMEGGIGPVAGSSHISLAYKMPGVSIVCPRTPKEYEEVWYRAISGDDPYIISEHRSSFLTEKEEDYKVYDDPDLVLLPISAPRGEVNKAIATIGSKLKVNVNPIVYLKPFLHFDSVVDVIKKSKFGAIIIDDDYTNGIAKSVAYDLMMSSGKPVKVMGLKDKSAGFSKDTDNLPPNELEILKEIEEVTLCKIY
jgi:acetoin:2,6-dichlorophenolindophenol oxidoreductase subunit beta